MGVEHRLQLVYARLPRVSCKGLCQQACGPIACSTLEAEIMERVSGRLLSFDAVSGRCTYLNDAGRCDVYRHRPLVCRSYGAAESLPCPHGCVPDTPPLDRAQELALFVKVLDIGGAPWMSQPDDWVEFSKHHSYHQQLKGRTLMYGPPDRKTP